MQVGVLTNRSVGVTGHCCFDPQWCEHGGAQSAQNSIVGCGTIDEEGYLLQITSSQLEIAAFANAIMKTIICACGGADYFCL